MIRVEVTQDDIDNGVRYSRNCPVTLAARRVFPDADPFTGAGGIMVEHKDGTVTCYKHNASKFLDDFHRYGRPVVPFTLILEKA